MSANTFISLFDKADGESTEAGKEKWIEVQGWDWTVEAESSWTKGGGASVGKPVPGRLRWEHRFDLASPVIIGFICTGKAFPKVELQMTRADGDGAPQTYFTMKLEGVFVTKVAHASADDGTITQDVEMVFKKVAIEYKPQSSADGSFGQAKTVEWDISSRGASTSG